jgi:hypothetical protein
MRSGMSFLHHDSLDNDDRRNHQDHNQGSNDDQCGSHDHHDYSESVCMPEHHESMPTHDAERARGHERSLLQFTGHDGHVVRGSCVQRRCDADHVPDLHFIELPDEL